MNKSELFRQTINEGYAFKGETILLGAGMLDGKVESGAMVHLPLRTMNRHGLIAGATGTGKTKTLQMISEALSDASIPVLLMDIKGDLSGLGTARLLTAKAPMSCSLQKLPKRRTGRPPM